MKEKLFTQKYFTMNSKNLLFLVFIVLSGMMIMSCEGPIGPAGADGTDGVNGSDGADGVDANAVCLTCHTLSHRAELTAQYDVTLHATSAVQWNGQTTVQYAGGRNGCAKCHSHEGFVETVATGMDTTAFNIQIPTRIGCTTCHSSHETFDFENDGADFALRTVEPVNLLIADEVLDFGNTSNLCAACHQPRRPAPVADDNGNFNITSSHYGPHHAPNATFLVGMGGYEVAGPDAYPAVGSATHAASSSCVDCHMFAYADGQGGHALVPSDASCVVCHTNGIPDMEAEIVGLMDDLAALLMAEGVLDADAHVVKGEFPVDVAGAFFNWKLVKEDLSHGIHNPAYTRALLNNSIAALQ